VELRKDLHSGLIAWLTLDALWSDPQPQPVRS